MTLKISGNYRKQNMFLIHRMFLHLQMNSNSITNEPKRQKSSRIDVKSEKTITMYDFNSQMPL